MIELVQLKCFSVIAEELHFGRASARLNMAQPTLTRQIQALERALDVQLFHRSSRVVRLTSAGRVFLPEAKRILALTESAANWAKRAWHGEAGIIRLGFTATAAFVDLPLILQEAEVQLPDIKILLTEGTSVVQKEDLLADILDVALLRPPIDHQKFETMPVRSEPFVAALHREDELATKSVLRPEDFHGQKFVMYSVEGAGYSHRIISEVFSERKIAPVITHQLAQNHSILALVSAGMGSALLPYSLTKLTFPDVVFREVVWDSAEPLDMLMVWRSENDNPALPAFREMCRSVFPASSA